MTRLPTTVIGDAYTSTHCWDVLTELVEVGNRMAGQEGEKEGARIITSAFEDAGLREVGIDEFDLDGWWRDTSTLSIEPQGHTFEHQHQMFALPGSPSGEVTAEIDDLGYGLPENVTERDDLEGKIAMARSDTPDDHRWVHRIEKYTAAHEAGAAAFIFRNHVEGCLPPTGEIGWGPRPGPVPAVGVSAEVGGRIERYCANGTPTGSLSVACRCEPTTSVNAEGVVGPDTDDVVLVTAHVDGHDISEGARDNGVGSALVAEIGRILAGAEAELDTKVRLVTFGSEEIGLFGAKHWADSHELNSVKAVLNIDGAGYSDTPHVRSYNYPSVVEAFETATDTLDIPMASTDGLSPHTDAWEFAARGVPAVTAGSVTETSGRGWGHTHADTLDKLDSRHLRTLAITFAETAIELADSDRTIDHRDVDVIEEEVEDAHERELKGVDRWPF
ncbi:MAG: M28 family peptidase [Halobacteriales archaeon]